MSSEQNQASVSRLSAGAKDANDDKCPISELYNQFRKLRQACDNSKDGDDATDLETRQDQVEQQIVAHKDYLEFATTIRDEVKSRMSASVVFDMFNCIAKYMAVEFKDYKCVKRTAGRSEMLSDRFKHTEESQVFYHEMTLETVELALHRFIDSECICGLDLQSILEAMPADKSRVWTEHCLQDSGQRDMIIEHVEDILNERRKVAKAEEKQKGVKRKRKR